MQELRARSRAVVRLFVIATLASACRDAREPATSHSISQSNRTDLAPPRAAFRVPAPPVELTSADGQGLKLLSLDARAVVDGPLAFTELHFVFENTEARTREGTFRIALPAGATPSRFAMRMPDGVFREGEVVEKARARVAYEDALHHKRDPALLESGAGNDFSARVFPILPNERKEIILSYAQTVTKDAPYRIALRGLPRVQSLSVTASVEGKESKLAAKDTAPDTDFTLDAAAYPTTDAVRSGSLAVVRVRPEVPGAPEPLENAVFLVDTSASRALDLDLEIARLATILAAMPESARVSVAAFDQTVVPVYEGEARRFGADGAEKIRSRGALGASNIDAALAWAGGHAKSLGAKRVVLMSDGVATAGSVDTSQTADASFALGKSGVERVDAIAFGGIRDTHALEETVRCGLARDGVVIDGESDGANVVRRLGEATAVVPVKIEGATWTWPQTLTGVQTGDERIVLAEIPAVLPLRMSMGRGEAHAVGVRSTVAPLLERAVAEAHVEDLLTEPQTKETIQKIVSVSTSKRVLSPYTSMVVLESEWDYQTFGIQRTALTDVLTVDGNQVAWTKRTSVQIQPKESESEFGMIGMLPGDPNMPNAPWGRESGEAPNDPSSARGNMWGESVGDSFGQGGLGLSGAGEGGGGQGEGIGLGSVGVIGRGAGAGSGSGQGFGNGHRGLAGAHQQSSPTIREAATTVNGRVPPEVIQRIVRQNFGRFRLCYEAGLRRNATLQGRVVTKFVIGRDGAVAAAQDGGSDLPDRDVVGCVNRTFMNLMFPQPDGGIVTVTYPIVFAPGDGSPPPPVPMEPTPPMQASPRSFENVTPPSLPPPIQKPVPYTGRMADVLGAISAKKPDEALRLSRAWHDEAPGDTLALVALGESLEASGDRDDASRAYGSVIDLFSNRADLRRFAGERLERVGTDEALDLAIDTYEKAVKDRPDHPSSHRLLAYALAKRNRWSEAFAAIVKGFTTSYPPGRFAGVVRVLGEDVGLIGAGYIAAEPASAGKIRAQLATLHVKEETEPSLRFVLNWESDANDVDFHIVDANGNHASYQNPTLATGGELYADVTTGYGPECFAIRAKTADRSPEYKLYANYYSMGPMGYGMGKLEVIDHDGHGHLTFSERPFVVMTDRATVSLGEVEAGSLAVAAK